MDKEEKRRERLIRRRMRLLEAVKKEPIHRAWRIVKTKLYFDREFQIAFLSREDLDKKTGLKACMYFKDYGSWVYFLKKQETKLSIEEKIFFACEAEKYNTFYDLQKSVLFRNSSILDIFLLSEEFKKFLEESSSLRIFLLKIKIDNEKVLNALNKKRETESEKIILVLPKIVIFLIGIIPIRMLSYVENIVRRLYLKKQKANT